jgi:hypothetical protein
MRRATGAIADGHPSTQQRSEIQRFETRRRVHDAASSFRILAATQPSRAIAPKSTRRDARVLAKRGGERARLAETDRESDLGDRSIARQQRLGPLDAPIRHVT